MGNALGEGMAPGILQGMQGTLPLTDLAPDFEQRLLAQDAGLVDFNYAGESYDAVMLIALAAEQSEVDQGQDIGAAINGLTSGGQKCTTFADCKAIIASGGVDYDGVTGTLDFTPSDRPAPGRTASRCSTRRTRSTRARRGASSSVRPPDPRGRVKTSGACRHPAVVPLPLFVLAAPGEGAEVEAR